MLGAHSEASLAAMQLGGALEWSVWSVFAAFEVGTIARVGRHVGAKEPALARRAALISLALAGGIGTLLTLLTPFVLAALPRIAPNASPASIAEAQGYLSVAFAASPIGLPASQSGAISVDPDLSTLLAMAGTAGCIVGLAWMTRISRRPAETGPAIWRSQHD